MSKNKTSYSGKSDTLIVVIPEEWTGFLHTITDVPIEFVKYLIEQELFMQGMVNIEPVFQKYRSDLFTPP